MKWATTFRDGTTHGDVGQGKSVLSAIKIARWEEASAPKEAGE
jgi:hypothetical protein